jgi:hypothetical protein
MKLMGYPVQPADHGTPGVQQTTPVKVKGAHEMYRFRPGKGRGELPAYGICQACRYPLLFFRKIGPPVYKIQIFQHGMMIKQGPAAIVNAPPALKSIIMTGPGIGPVHIGIDIFQLFQKRCRGI